MISWRDIAYFAALSVVDGISAGLIALAWLNIRRVHWRIIVIGIALLIIISGDWRLKQELGK